MRWLHTYVSMLGLGALVFFSLTGLTLNHPDWTFGEQRREVHFKGQLEAKWLAPGGPDTAVDRLAIVEALRRNHNITGLVDDFRTDETECSIAFKGPGNSADAVVQRKTGQYELTVAHEGVVSLLNDLHKGRHTGSAWAWVIDVSAVILGAVSISGIWLLLYVRRRRRSGLWVGLVGAALLWVLFWIGVQ